MVLLGMAPFVHLSLHETAICLTEKLGAHLEGNVVPEFCNNLQSNCSAAGDVGRDGQYSNSDRGNNWGVVSDNVRQNTISVCIGAGPPMLKFWILVTHMSKQQLAGDSPKSRHWMQQHEPLKWVHLREPLRERMGERKRRWEG